MKRIRQANSILLLVSVIAVIALIVMNLYSLNRLQEQDRESQRESRKIQLDEFSLEVRIDLIEPLLPLWQQDLAEVRNGFPKKLNFSERAEEVLANAAVNPVYSGIYFTPFNQDPCSSNEVELFIYSIPDSHFIPYPEPPPQAVCDGMLNSKTRAQVLVEGADAYRWNAKISYDTQRSFTLAFLDLERQQVHGHLTFLLDEKQLIDSFLAPRLVERFGPETGSPIAVWLRDWTSNEILASSHPDVEYNPEIQPIDLRQGFPDFLDYWALHASFIQTPEPALSGAALYRNLAVLGLSSLVLMVGLTSMFFSIRRERALSHRQSEFIANVTHELKTPLSVIQAAGENIADGRVVEAARLSGYGQHIHRESQRLRGMIDKLLDVARSESDQLIAKPSVISVREFLEAYRNDHKAAIDEAGFELDFRVADSVGSIRVDPDQLETILNNLVDNAMKYSGEKKRIDLHAYPTGSSVEIAVRDYGIGISRQAQKKIFDKFYRVENTLTAHTKGHGLGLAIVKRLVEGNRGSVLVSSAPGEGTQFMLRFPQV